MITPLIKQINRNSLITFPSSLEDFNISGQGSVNREVFFSHFALLNLPDITTTQSSNINCLDVERFQKFFVNGRNVGADGVGDRIDISESLQNYMLNYESLLTEQSHYDKSKLETTSERIFFKWLKEIGAIRYRKSSDSVTNDIRYQEESVSANYNRVIQYISKIGAQGKVYGKKNSFNEVYVNIPSSLGMTDKVLLKSVEDTNYFSNMVVVPDVDSEFINGFDSNDTPPNGLSTQAIYDKDVSVEYTSEDMNGTPVANWNDYYLGLNSYLTDGDFSEDANDLVTMKFGAKTKTFLRPKLDGVKIDFDVTSYSNEARNIEDYNSKFSHGSYDFNCILLYYTVTDLVTRESAINLYGVAFIGDVKQTAVGVSSIERKSKVKSDNIIGNVGNGYGFRFNFKLDSRQEDINPKIEIDEFETNTFSMVQFTETMLRMNEILGRYEKLQEANDILIKKNESLLSFIEQLGVGNINDRFEEINKTIQQSQTVDNQLIDQLYKKLNEILSGQTDVDVNIVTSFLASRGLSFQFDETNNVMRLVNEIQDYDSTNKMVLQSSIGNINNIKLESDKKYVLFDSDIAVINPVNIVLDDTINWKNGQTISIGFDKNMVASQIPLKIYTDADSKKVNVPFNYKITEDYLNSGDVINVTCIDKNDFKFIITKSTML